MAVELKCHNIDIIRWTQERKKKEEKKRKKEDMIEQNKNKRYQRNKTLL